MFSKALINQFKNETAIKLDTADPLGVIGSFIYAQNELRWNGVSMIDILISKYHVVCGTLFGVYGPEATPQGKARLGWGKDGGQWVAAGEHERRMTGLAAGYAGLTLRDYSKAKLTNPYPAYHFWQAVAAITNVPPQLVQPTHCIVLKALVEGNERRIVDLFGDMGVALLRHAVGEFPERAPMSTAREQLKTLRRSLELKRIVLA